MSVIYGQIKRAELKSSEADVLCTVCITNMYFSC